MSRLTRTFRALLAIALGAMAAPLAGQAPIPVASGSPAPTPAPAPPPSLKLTGYAEASYVYSPQADTTTKTILGHLYDRYSQAFTINAFKLSADLPFDAKKVSAGVHGDVVLGQNAEVLHAAGSGGAFSLGTDGDIEQAYVTLNVPTSNGNGVQFKLGKMVTLMGLEVIEDPANPVWSEGLLFTYAENFTATGLEMDFKPASTVDVELRVDNGWDRVTISDGHPSFMGRIGIAPTGSTTIGLLGFYGDEEAGISAARYGGEFLITQKAGKATVWIQGDYGKEKQNAALFDPTQDASWWGISGWLAGDASPTVNLSARADYMNDAEGARTGFAYAVPTPGAGHKLWSVTGNLNIKTFPSVLVRPEVRYDHSSFAVFENGQKGSQVVLAISAAYQF
jgi:hypothetical protein